MKNSSAAVALVTGAGSGLGKVIAESLADQGWVVVINDIDADAANKTSSNINDSGASASAIAGDVGNENDVERIFNHIDDTHNQPATLLVNNAGVQTWSPFLALELKDWQRTINTNLTGCFLMSKAFTTHCINAGTSGSIINIGSGCNTQAFPNLVDYAASKGGIEVLTKTAARELGPHGIRVNCIAPGAIATERTAAETGDYVKSWSELTPLGRIGTPQDVANAVLLLSDEKAAFISGQTINVDGALFAQSVWPRDY